MPDVRCPSCETPLDAAALREGSCPRCSATLPAFVRKQAAAPNPEPPRPREIGWLPFAALLAVGATGGWFFGAVKHGQLVGPLALLPLTVYVLIAAGWWIEGVRKRKARRAATQNRESKS